MRVPTTLAACSLTLVGCLSVHSTQLGPPRLVQDRPLVAAEDVAIYREADQVPGDYEEVGLLHATGSLSWSTESEMYRKMREEAARLGANAIILVPMPELSVREKIRITEKNLDIGREGRAVAIYVLPADGEKHGAARDDAKPLAIDASYIIRLEGGLVIPAETIDPSGLDQLKVTQPDGTTRYLSANKIRSVTDRRGADCTKRVVEERQRAPRTAGL